MRDYDKVYNWASRMDVLFGLPWDKTGSAFEPYPELLGSKVMVHPQHLTDAKHPYDNRMIVVRVHTPKQSTEAQQKAFALGYSWGGGGKKVQHTEYPCLIFGSEKTITYSTNANYAESRSLREYSLEDFWYGNKLPSPVKKTKKTAEKDRYYTLGDTVKFNLPGEVSLEYKVKDNGAAGYFLGATGIKNAAIFDYLGLNKIEFMERVLDYHDDGKGDFPYCDDLEDLNDLIEELHRICDKYENPVGTSPTKSNQINTKQDGRIIKVQRETPAIRSGEGPRGRAISGKASRASVRSGYVSYTKIASRI